MADWCENLFEYGIMKVLRDETKQGGLQSGNVDNLTFCIKEREHDVAYKCTMHNNVNVQFTIIKHITMITY